MRVYMWGDKETVHNWRIRGADGEPNMERIADACVALPVSGPVFVDCERWDHRQPGRTPEATNATIAAFAMPTRLGVYGCPVTECWMGIEQSLAAQDVPSPTLASRLARWRGWTDAVDVSKLGVWCPDLYPRTANPRAWLRGADLMMDECARRHTHVKPVVPFVSYHMQGKGEPLELSYWRAIVRWLASSVSSVVLYEPPSTPQLEVYRDVLKAV